MSESNPRSTDIAREEVVDKARNLHRENVDAPLTQRQFLQKVRLGDRQFYNLFHGGWDELCQLAGIPRHPHRGMPSHISRDQLLEAVRIAARTVGKKTLSLVEFERSSRIGPRVLYKLFPTEGWAGVCRLVGIEPSPGYHAKVEDEQALQEFHRIVSKHRRIPPRHVFDSESNVSIQTIQKRFGGRGGLLLGYRDWLFANHPTSPLLALPELPRMPGSGRSDGPPISSGPAQGPLAQPPYPQSVVSDGPARISPESRTSDSPSNTYRPAFLGQDGKRRRTKDLEFGEPINFRGLQHAPVNEQGVVFLFGLVSRDLGFLVESVRTSFPDCEGKRCTNAKKNRWQRVLIEFEYRASGFREHGHDPTGCDVVVCWENDWRDCPLEVIELRSEISKLGH